MDGKWIMVDVVNSRLSFLFFPLEQEKLEFELVETKRGWLAALFNGTIILLERLDWFKILGRKIEIGPLCKA